MKNNINVGAIAKIIYETNKGDGFFGGTRTYEDLCKDWLEETSTLAIEIYYHVHAQAEAVCAYIKRELGATNMTNLQKLIANGWFIPISEECFELDVAYLVLFNDGCITIGRAVSDDKWWDCCDDNLEIQPTHFMPLNTPERMAKVIEVLVDEFQKLSVDKKTSFYVMRTASLALQKAEQIAGGENESTS